MLNIVWGLIMSIDCTSRKNGRSLQKKQEGRSLELILAETAVVQ
jgi:hypothetical protein